MATTITANGINFPDGSASAPSIGGTDTNTGLFTGSDLVGFATGGVERIKIDAQGDIFIGTTSDIAPANGTNLCVSDGTISRLILEKQSTIKFGLNVSNGFSIYDETNDAQRFGIASNGNVSIGNNPTVHADTIFHIEDSGETNIKVEGSTSTLGARISLQNNDTTANSYSQYAFNDAGGQSTSAIQGINTDQTNNYGEMAFLTRNAQGLPPTERVRIDKDGNVGIGTTNPNAQLHILKSLQANLVIGSSSAGGAYLILDGDSNGDSSGGDYAYIGHTTAGDLIVAADNPAGAGSVFLKSNGASYQAVGCYASGSVELRYQNGTRFQTTSTGAILTSGAAGTTSCRFGNTANRGLEVKVLNHGNNDAGAVLNAADSENSGYAAYIAFQTGGEEKARFEGQYDNFRLSNTCSGITFNGDYAAANRLNDYEIGTFTPTMGTHSNNQSTSGIDSSHNGTGWYVKVGGLVTINVDFPALHNNANNHVLRYISGLPFTSASDNKSTAAIGSQRGLHFRYASSQETTDCHFLYGTVGDSSTILYLNASKASSPYSGWPATHNNSGASQYLRITLSYKV